METTMKKSVSEPRFGLERGRIKKFLDKHVAQSYKGQVIALAIAFALMIIAGAFVGMWVLDEKGEDTAKFGNRAIWGLMQCVDGGFVDATITSNTKIEDGQITENAPVSVIVVSLGFWLFGLILVSFFTGAATDFIASRREKILSGDVSYSFGGDYVLIVGYDFQVKSLVRALMDRHNSAQIVLLTDSDAASVHEDLLPELGSADRRRLFILRRDVTSSEAYAKMTIMYAKEIYVIGDGDAVGRDGKVLRALDEITKKAIGEKRAARMLPVKMYVHVEDSAVYSRIRAMELPPDRCGLFDVEVYNYYESWAWKCWSEKDSTDGDAAYLPIRFRKESKRAELFIVGAGRMGRAMADFAMPLMNYGLDGKPSRITLFDVDPLKKGFLPDAETLRTLPEVEVVFSATDGCSDEANDAMLRAASRDDTSVTVVIALSDPALALRAFSELSNRLRRREVSVLVWQATRSGNCPDKRYLRMGGADSVADRTSMRYFGMTDILPWKESSRFDNGMAVNFFYDSWYPYGRETPDSPPATSENFVATAKAMWDEAGHRKAAEAWAGTKRWKKWASVNSGDTFREKSVLFANASYASAAELVLKAEHDRWWTEKLLGGWLQDDNAERKDDSHADKPRMLHGDMVPFERLSDEVKDKDKVNIAAMVACGFIEPGTNG